MRDCSVAGAASAKRSGKMPPPIVHCARQGLVMSRRYSALISCNRPATQTRYRGNCKGCVCCSLCRELRSIPYVIMSEIFPSRVRDLGMSLAASADWGCNVVFTVTFLTLIETLGQANLFWVYCGIGLAGLAFSYFTVPETRGCSLEEIEQNLMAGMPTRRPGEKRTRSD
jgi:hypothetical protein